MKRKYGFTVPEMLIAAVIVGVLSTITIVGTRQIARSQEAVAGINSIRQIIWQGATAAASRGQTLELFRSNAVLQVRTVVTSPATPTVIRQITLPSSVANNLTLPQGVSYRFLPPGRLNFNGVNATFSTDGVVGKNYSFTVSQIGEVQVQ